MINNGLSVKEFARRVGVAASVVGYWLDLRIFPTVDSAIKVANYLHCSLDYLFGLSDNPDFVPGNNTASFGDRFEMLRLEKDVSLYRIAKETKIAYSATFKWTHGRYVKIESLIKLADYFGVSLDYLVGRSDVR